MSKLAMDAEYALAMTDMNEAWGLENFTAWSGPITDERAAQAHALHSSSAQHCLNAVAVAPDDTSVAYLRNQHTVAAIHYARQHAMPDFDPVQTCGEGGARLRETVER